MSKYEEVYIDKIDELEDENTFLINRLSELIGTITNDMFTKPYTDVKHIDDYIGRSTFDKMTTQSDVIDMINDIDNLDELKNTLEEYFDLKSY